MDQAKELMKKVANPKKNITSSSTTRRATRRSRSRCRRSGSSSGSRPRSSSRSGRSSSSSSARRRTSRSTLPARVDRRLRRRDELPRALDVQVGQQQLELLRPAPTTRSSRRRSRPRTTTERYRHLRAGRGQADRRRTARVPIAPIYWYTYVQLERPRVQGRPEHQPAHQATHSKVERWSRARARGRRHFAGPRPASSGPPRS